MNSKCAHYNLYDIIVDKTPPFKTKLGALNILPNVILYASLDLSHGILTLKRDSIKPDLLKAIDLTNLKKKEEGLNQRYRFHRKSSR